MAQGGEAEGSPGAPSQAGTISAPVAAKAQQIAGTIQQAPPQVQQEAQGQFTQAYGQRIQQSLHDTYTRSYGFYNPQGVSEQQFMQQADQLTNHFDISNPYTAAVLYPGDPVAQGKFLDAAQKYVQLKTIGISTAMDQSPLSLSVKSHIPPMMLGSNDNQKIMAYNNLKESLTKLAGGGKIAEANVQNTLQRIMAMNVPKEEKKKMVLHAAQELGVPLNTLESVGVNTEAE
jgi:hypothetical protein